MSKQTTHKTLKAVLDKYIQGKANQQETDAVNAWYEQLGIENQNVFPLNSADSKRALANSIKRHLTMQLQDKKKSRSYLRFFKYAAILLLTIGIGTTAYQYLKHKRTPQNDTVFTANDKQIKQINLPDGSQILLNVGSTLTISKDFGEQERNVSLRGEAFFKVAKDKTRPFIIKTGVLLTRVVGTSFNINAYPDMDKIKVAVLTGKVKVFKKTARLAETIASGMTKGTSLSYDKSTGKTTLKNEDASLLTLWKDNKLYIDNATIGEIAKQLARHYRAKIVFDPKTDKGQRYTIRFNGEPVGRVMEVLSLLTKRKFTYQTNQITIK